MSRQNVHIFSFKKPSIIDGLPVIRTTETKSRPQRVNSYELNLFITDTAVIEKIPNPDQAESAQGESRLVWLMSYAR